MVEGVHLSAILAGGRSITPARAVAVPGQVAGALDAAHAAGVVVGRGDGATVAAATVTTALVTAAAVMTAPVAEYQENWSAMVVVTIDQLSAAPATGTVTCRMYMQSADGRSEVGTVVTKVVREGGSHLIDGTEEG